MKKSKASAKAKAKSKSKSKTKAKPLATTSANVKSKSKAGASILCKHVLSDARKLSSRMERLFVKHQCAANKTLNVDSAMSAAFYEILMVIQDHPGKGQTEYGDMVGVDRTTTSYMVRRMTAQGYVTRERTEDDQRMIAIAITDQGRSALREAQEAHRRLEADLLKIPGFQATMDNVVAIGGKLKELIGGHTQSQNQGESRTESAPKAEPNVNTTADADATV